ncbi:MAG: 4Fe-4S dicluster domain-containing protein [Bacteroidales bacterium]|nr:4Fe-4S dicluster domain-containing protein [Bacteroidales bacterium]
MKDFGFTLSPSSAVSLDKVDSRLWHKLLETSPDAAVCISCGSCSASCPAARWSGMSIRKVLLALQRGQSVAPMLSCCMLCGKCTMVCPRGINTRKLILALCRICEKP